MKITYSELFYSIQGEGKYVGTPSIFLRLWGCNFECAGFGQPRGTLMPKEDMPYMQQDISGIASLSDLPVTTIGCDSSASWHRKYKKFAVTETVEELAKKIRVLLGDLTWSQVHLVITGGEPLLPGHQRALSSLLLDTPELLGLHNITFETNGTQVLSRQLRETIAQLDMITTFSVSPKLSISGESAKDAIKPCALSSYNTSSTCEVYLKFVVRDKECLADVRDALLLYDEESVEYEDVYLMPEGATLEGQSCTEADVAQLCLRYGFKFSSRLHIQLFGNAWAT